MALKSLFEVNLSAHSGKVEQNRRHPLQAGGFFLPTIFLQVRSVLEIRLRDKLLGDW